jgi:outer membrane protein TolC
LGKYSTKIQLIGDFKDFLLTFLAISLQLKFEMELIKSRNMKKQLSLIILLMTSLSISTPAQELSVPAVLTLEDCKERAILSSKDMEQARTEMEMASYDRKIALANYFPNISATGAYLHNSRDIALVSDTQSQLLRNAGTLLQGELNTAASGAISQVSAAMTDKMTQLMTAIQTNPALAAEYMGSPMWQTILGMLIVDY